MTQAELDKQVEAIVARFTQVNDFFIEKVAEQVRLAGELIPSSIDRISIMASMNKDILAINQKLAQALQLAMPDLYKLYMQATQDFYTDDRFKRAIQLTPLTEGQKESLRHYTETVYRQTAGRLSNLSNTTLISGQYRRVVDNAILAASSGLWDYKSLTRESVRQLGYGGLQVRYPSGYHRRLDSAVQQNIRDGTNQLAQQGSMMVGEQLQYDAVEISAHARPAPDHAPIQGHVFLLAEFDKLQSEMPFQDVDGHQFEAIRRPIGEWNCMHIAMSFSTKYSKRKHTDEQLEKWIKENEEGCTIGGRHYTTYEASQLMRKIETQTRQWKDAANAARAAGDEDLRRECQRRINALAAKYKDVAGASGLTQRKDRMHVNGFRMVKV